MTLLIELRIVKEHFTFSHGWATSACLREPLRRRQVALILEVKAPTPDKLIIPLAPFIKGGLIGLLIHSNHPLGFKEGTG
jgi:hypothetical protein